jgi:hypothetical protein
MNLSRKGHPRNRDPSRSGGLLQAVLANYHAWRGRGHGREVRPELYTLRAKAILSFCTLHGRKPSYLSAQHAAIPSHQLSQCCVLYLRSRLHSGPGKLDLVRRPDGQVCRFYFQAPRFQVQAAKVGVPPSGGLRFPAEAGTPAGHRLHPETEEPSTLVGMSVAPCSPAFA